MSPTLASLKSLLTNGRACQRLAELQRNSLVATSEIGNVIGSIWDGKCLLKAGENKVSCQDLARLLSQVNGHLVSLGDKGIPSRSHSDVRLKRYRSGRGSLIVDISIDGVLMPLLTNNFSLDEELFEPGWISTFATDILNYVQGVCRVRNSFTQRDHLMAQTMADFAAAIDNPALPLWLRLSPVHAASSMIPRGARLCYDFAIQTLDDKLEPGVALGCAFSATQLQGLIELHNELERKLLQRKQWLFANNAIGIVDSLTAALLKHHNIGVRNAYQRCFEEHCQTGKPLVIHETDTAQHSIFFEKGCMRCNVTSPQVSITGRLLSVPLELPGAPIAAAHGRMIGELLENSVLAASQARIIKAESWSGRTSFELETPEELITA